MNQSAGGSSLWQEVHPSIQVTDGIYNVILGTIVSLSFADFDDDLWMSVIVDGQEILPRAQIVGTPYSLLSFEALTMRVPGEIAGETNVQGNELLKISQSGTGDVLEIDGGGVASSGINIFGVDLVGVSAGAEFGPAFSASGGQSGFSAGGQSADGFSSSNAGDDGLQITNAGNDGIIIDGTGDDGIQLEGVGDDAVLVINPTGNGIVVSGAGDYAFDFQDVPDTDAGGNLTAYVGRVENTSAGTSSDALAIQIETPGDPGTAANFVGFFDGDNELIGQIEGNGSGGVAYNTTGADYAEYLPRVNASDNFQAGDIVGVFDGRISRTTDGAQQVMVITDRAAVLGNAPSGQDTADGYESVGFIGQVQVRVRGAVEAGDYVVASGLGDGVGLAVGPEDLRLEQVSSVVGQAWETSNLDSERRVNIVVGLDQSGLMVPTLTRELEERDSTIESLSSRLRALESRLGTY